MIDNQDLELVFSLLAKGTLRGERIAYFLGAGASLHEPARTANGLEDETSTRRMPSARRLAEDLSQLLGEGPLMSGAPTDLLGIATYFEILRSRSKLAKALTELLDVRYGPGRLHALLASLPGAPIILTTNYDRFVERAFDEVGRPYHLIVAIVTPGPVRFFWYAPSDQTPRMVDPGQYFEGEFPMIVKLHGSLKTPDEMSDSFVISEEDYYICAGRQQSGTFLPGHVAGKLHRNHHIVFLGYGLADIHIRHAFLKGSFEHFVFNMEVSPFQKKYWPMLGVRPFELECGEFAERFADALRRMQSQ